MTSAEEPESKTGSGEEGGHAKRSSATNDSSERRSRSGGLSDWTEALRDMAPYLDLGWRLAGSAAGPPILGYLVIDVWLGTTPWGLLIGAAVGFAAALLQLKRLQGELDQ